MKMEQLQRGFKGIWIPKEIWETKELTLHEKIILVEIESLDNDDGCYASNKYFADFFVLSNGRISQIINSLIKKRYLLVEYIRKDKQIIKRILKINRPPYPEVFNKLNRGIKYSKEGYLENDKDNNINNNNINICSLENERDNSKSKITEEMYINMANKIYSYYPKKKGKQQAIKSIINLLKGNTKFNSKKIKLTPEEIADTILKQDEYIEENKIQEQFIPYASTFFNSKIFDFLEV